MSANVMVIRYLASPAPCRRKELRSGVSPQPDAQGVPARWVPTGRNVTRPRYGALHLGAGSIRTPRNPGRALPCPSQWARTGGHGASPSLLSEFAPTGSRASVHSVTEVAANGGDGLRRHQFVEAAMLARHGGLDRLRERDVADEDTELDVSVLGAEGESLRS